MPCNSPLEVKHNGIIYKVPCRFCLGCRVDRRNEWNFRIRNHYSYLIRKGYRSSFVTLTYDENHYKGGVIKKDIVDFLKRLRYYVNKCNDVRVFKDFKYYIVSEIGENTARGHYHGVFLGLDSEFLKPFLRKTWDKGFIQCSALIPARISYTLKYMDKQSLGKSYKVDLNDVTKLPFALMSKGIGVDYLKEHVKDAEENGVLWSNGHFVKYPKYYAKKFGVDTAILSKTCLDNLEKLAKINKMSVSEYTKNRAVSNEKSLIARARNSGCVVQTDSLRAAESYIKKSSKEGENLAKELINYENE